MNRREFLSAVARISSVAIATKVIPAPVRDPFSLKASGPHEIDFHRGGIYFDPISFDMGEAYIFKLTFDRPVTGSF